MHKYRFDAWIPRKNNGWIARLGTILSDTMLVYDMDLSRRVFHEVMVEREGLFFYVEVSYEWMLDYCSLCQIVSHHSSTC